MMQNRIKGEIVAVVVVMLLLLGCAGIEGNVTRVTVSHERIHLGYCPTMAPHAERMAATNENVIHEAFGSTAAAFQALRRGTVDAILVGRVGKPEEANGLFEERLGNGATLIGEKKRYISREELARVTIHTALEAEALSIYKGLQRISTHATTEEALHARGTDELALIPWDSFRPGIALVIPVDEHGDKISEYRLPVLYSAEQEPLADLRASFLV